MIKLNLRHISLLLLLVLVLVLLAIWSQSAGQEALVRSTPAAPPQDLIELQPLRAASTVELHPLSGPPVQATLTNLNPGVGRWYLLSIGSGESPAATYHLETASSPDRWVLGPDGASLYLESADTRCEVWTPRSAPLDAARATGLPYAPLCGQRLYLRNPAVSTYTELERVTGFLRDHVWGGDEIVNFVRDAAFRDAFIEGGIARTGISRPVPSEERPVDALIDSGLKEPAVVPEHLGITASAAGSSFMLGCWYAIDGQPGTWLSVMRPGAVPPGLLAEDKDRVAALDPVESNGLDFMVAFDLSQFRMRFELGTDHPRLDWSDRVLPGQRVAEWPGPDGVGSSLPLARTGMVSPAETAAVVATFAGGFKREHGAFHFGELAQRNHGSHYGFMQQGVIFSRLQPGLATVFTRTDDAVELRTWTAGEDRLLDQLVDARQNGVPLIEYDPVADRPRPGELVNQWGAGNWSGSNERQLRTVRSGLCMQHGPARDFLVFGYFSAATPSAMTRVFQAYGCRYAMQLDINALEHTYFALYTRGPGRVQVEHLVQGMDAVDRKGGPRLAPRFLGFPDDRDFFYMMRRSTP